MEKLPVGSKQNKQHIHTYSHPTEYTDAKTTEKGALVSVYISLVLVIRVPVLH